MSDKCEKCPYLGENPSKCPYMTANSETAEKCPVIKQFKEKCPYYNTSQEKPCPAKECPHLKEYFNNK
tara:strand:- start:2118 stop:2321 length:204 start_codon:yes stop_codon:yes gene_type:complete